MATKSNKTKSTRQNYKQKYEQLLATYTHFATSVSKYVNDVDARRAVAHSTTGQEVNGKTTGVSIGELITIVGTAKSLKKHVVLEVSGSVQNPLAQKLVINLVDEYPTIDWDIRRQMVADNG